MNRKQHQLPAQLWCVQIKVQDIPAAGEIYLSADEVREVFNKVDLPAGISFEILSIAKTDAV